MDDTSHAEHRLDWAASATGQRPHAIDASRAYWLVMLAGSTLGTNAGDLWADFLFPGRLTSLASLLAICGVAVWYDRSAAGRSEGAYWITVIAMRAAATNLADFLTHDLALGYLLVSVLLCILTLIAARFTNPEPARGRAPRVDGAYWTAMFIAGLFGTVAGDLIHHTIGLYTASVALCFLLAGLILVRDIRALTSVMLYWSIVMAERCAGTALGDTLASHRGVGLGVPVATLCTSALFIALLWSRAKQK